MANETDRNGAEGPAGPLPSESAQREALPAAEGGPAGPSSPMEAGPPTEPPPPAGPPPGEAAPLATRAASPGPAPETPRLGPAGSTLLVRHGLMRTVGQFRHDLAAPPAPGTKAVIRTDRGVEIGEVVIGIGSEPSPRCATPQALEQFLRACAGTYPLRSEGTVLRLANAQDLIDQRHFQTGAHEEAAFCRQQIRELSLPMRLVTAEHLLGGERIIFFFTSEQRVDFRELVRRLAGQYRTRIEMRQVGARDEARVAADYERCGQRCCCQQFLKELQPVSMRMAKIQKATLDPSKISGRCGRLMCCLRYEDLAYDELRKQLPRKNIWVRTAERVGRVVDTQILTQLVRLELPDRTTVVVANEDILERDVPAPPLPPPPEPGERRGPPDRRPPQSPGRDSGPRRWPQAGAVGQPQEPPRPPQEAAPPAVTRTPASDALTLPPQAAEMAATPGTTRAPAPPPEQDADSEEPRAEETASAGQPPRQGGPQQGAEGHHGRRRRRRGRHRHDP